MQVILRENVENFGRIGDIVKVSDGYARNFLLPRGLVIEADEKNKAAIEHHKRGLEKKRQAQRAQIRRARQEVRRLLREHLPQSGRARQAFRVGELQRHRRSFEERRFRR